MLVTSLCFRNDGDQDVGDEKYVGDIFACWRHSNRSPTSCQNLMLVTDMLCWRHEIQSVAKSMKFCQSLNRS